MRRSSLLTFHVCPSEKVIERGENIDRLVTKTEGLRTESATFKVKAAAVKRKFWWKNVKLWVGIVVAFLVPTSLLPIVFFTSSLLTRCSGAHPHCCRYLLRLPILLPLHSLSQPPFAYSLQLHRTNSLTNCAHPGSYSIPAAFSAATFSSAWSSAPANSVAPARCSEQSNSKHSHTSHPLDGLCCAISRLARASGPEMTSE